MSDPTSTEALDHRGFVWAAAKRLSPRLPDGLELSDLAQAGFVALLRSRERYDPSKGAAFLTYAGYRIKGAMLDAIRDYIPGTRLLRVKVLSADEQRAFGFDVVDTAELPEDVAIRTDRDVRLHAAVDDLADRERQVCNAYYFGISTAPLLGLAWHVSQSRISQIHRSALGHLRADERTQ